ncbi:phosphatidylglycerol lysyltransferase [Clostridium tepidiprofundi DSM 19306]|uniref:Phosphatidylglycerol lysyltransferase n=1 Tax=Clostridium tepidiprofundi DSM 19306 TaxID=1121338 RepID=A0A151B502_9CLOT|nr:lysylphosphatidylglycerol synthase domain-containing protein [Clostridium tepidiprofundi]KYH34979.1 phosphatidylglycerol lysyltransferase [Clostridium tepidiprofundi DSM 19306]
MIFKVFTSIRHFCGTHKKQIIKMVMPIFIIVLILTIGIHQLKSININEAFEILHNMSISNIVFLFLGGIVAVSTMSLYDFAVVREYKQEISMFKIFNVGWVANTFNNAVGLGGIAGATLRTMMYKDENIDSKKLAYFNLLIIPACITGLSVMTLLDIVHVFDVEPILNRYRWLTIGLVIFSLYMPVYFFINKVTFLKNKIFSKVNNINSSPRLKFDLFFASIIEWFTAGSFFYFISTLIAGHIRIEQILGIFSVAATAGILSLIPSGLGSFDFIAILGLELMGIKSEQALAILLIYRVFYYIIPLFLGTILMVLQKIREGFTWNFKRK